MGRHEEVNMPQPVLGLGGHGLVPSGLWMSGLVKQLVSNKNEIIILGVAETMRSLAAVTSDRRQLRAEKNHVQEVGGDIRA